MTKTFILALATSLVLASGATAAFAAPASGTASVSIQVTNGSDETNLTAEQKAAAKAAKRADMVAAKAAHQACKNGGWKSYPSPGFKNQGDCVSHFTSNKVSFVGTSQVAGALTSWSVRFTTGPGGALVANNTITVVFNNAFTGIPASPIITFGGSFANCPATTGVTTGTTVVVTLLTGCTLGQKATGTVIIAGVTNPAAGTYAANTFTVATSVETTAVANAKAEKIR